MASYNALLACKPVRFFRRSRENVITEATEPRNKNWIFWPGQLGTRPGLPSERLIWLYNLLRVCTYKLYALTNIWLRLGYSLRWTEKQNKFSEVTIDAYIFHIRSNFGIWAYNQGQESRLKRVKYNIRGLRMLRKRHFLGVFPSYAAELYMS